MGELWGQALCTERRVHPGDMLLEHQLEKRFGGEAGPLGNVQGYPLQLRAGCLSLQGPMFSQHSPGRSWSSCFVTQLADVGGEGLRNDCTVGPNAGSPLFFALAPGALFLHDLSYVFTYPVPPGVLFAPQDSGDRPILSPTGL